VKTLHYLKRALSLPPHIVLKKIIRKLKENYKARKKRSVDEKFPTYSSLDAFGSMNHFVKKVDPSSLPAEKIQRLNEHFLKHEFDLLGSGWMSVYPGMDCLGIEGFRYPVSGVGRINEKNSSESARLSKLISSPYKPIDWHLDFKSGFRWSEDTWSQDIQYGSHMGADVKVPWELSRMQHLTALAWGYALDGKELCLHEFQNQILDFIASNPPRYGVNWVCTMDVGIRISNWLIAYDLFAAYGAKFDPEFEKVFIRSAYEHGHHIFRHLEWDPYLRSNHYLANLAGLLFASSYLPTNPEIESWFAFSVRELASEVLIQFNADGSNFEASTSYHRLSAEMVVYATALALEKQVQFSEEYLERIKKMGDFIRDITKPDGSIVQFGDNDSGRFIKMFPDNDMSDHRYLIPPIRALTSLDAVIQAQLTPFIEKRGNLSAYPDFGLFIQNIDPWFLAVRCGSIGQKGNGGHAHNDQLSFELAVQGVSMIVDPGTYVYTPLPSSRRHFRSTAMHNTLAIENKEQNEDQGLFKMKDRSHAKVIEFGLGIFIGEQVGFDHRRTLTISPSSVEGVDECNGSKKIYFHFAPGWEGIQVSQNVTEWIFGSVRVVISSDEGALTLSEGEYSSSYGQKQIASVLTLQSSSRRTVWKMQI